ncbi:R3H and coiled-coil domain-containing protein 1 [Halichoeres trimaculatus]|uniref:R3H and coiled-coil domain-containing protein 1 n=1 Tax=Halichoeres trimaculatus TaxID=147232 RepID=UPI003D9EC37E
MAFCCYSVKDECQFVHNVKDELEIFKQKSGRRRVLLFPPLPSRLRYLIHTTIENLPDFTTFSVGESWCRRVVVCNSELRGEVEEDIDLESNSSNSEMESDVKPKPSNPTRSRGLKKPDKPLYMPRAVRLRLSLQNPQGPSGEQESQSPASSSCSSISSSSDSSSTPAPTENSESSSTFGQDGDARHDADSSELCPQMLQMHHDAEQQVWSETVSHFADMSLKEEEEEQEDEEETKDLTTLIKAHLKEGVFFSIEHARNDYPANENLYLNPDEFRHVIEIYNFPPVFKTEDLLDAFTEFSDGGMKIKWIDNTHALGVFSSESAAIHALSISHPLLKARALAEGSKKAKGKAFRQAEFIQPVKVRPRTDCAVAQRMVTRALGLRGRGRAQRY